jgi:pyruvate,orthophosphate dikinase
VRTKAGANFDYKLGVMVETPRAALRAGEIAQHAAFLSFGTNDLTQMTYGLSRDDAGRFMNTYVRRASFPKTRSTSWTSTGWASCCTSGPNAAARPGRT